MRRILLSAGLSLAGALASASANDPKPTPIEIFVRSDGGITWNGEAVTLDEIAIRFDALRGDGPRIPLTIRPDKFTSYQRFAAVMSILQKSQANVDLGIVGGAAKPE